MFRGREVIHADIGLRLLQRMVDSLKEDAVVDRTPLMYGKRMIMILSPLASQKTKTKEKVKEA